MSANERSKVTPKTLLFSAGMLLLVAVGWVLCIVAGQYIEDRTIDFYAATKVVCWFALVAAGFWAASLLVSVYRDALSPSYRAPVKVFGLLFASAVIAKYIWQAPVHLTRVLFFSLSACVLCWVVLFIRDYVDRREQSQFYDE
jgi:hypothetical protein